MECPICHTVYFLEGGKNRDRMYHQIGEDGKEQWKLLCICGEQIFFEKKDVALYGTRSAARDVGYAVEGNWKRSLWVRPSESQSKPSSGVLEVFSNALGLTVQEFSQIRFLVESKATEKGRPH